MHSPPEGLLNKLRTLGQLVHVGSFQPKTVRRAPCQEVVIEGDAVDLFQFPIIKCWPLDGGRYITLPLVINARPRDRNTELRHVPDAGVRQKDHRNALADPQGWRSPLRVGRDQGITEIGRGSGAGSGPGDNLDRVCALPPDMDEMVVAVFCGRRAWRW